MKILNLFAGIGGNRTLWGDEHEITAVEKESITAYLYYKRFPNDNVIVGDAYQYLEERFHEFDGIWASPPCPSHSLMSRTHVGRRYNGWKMKCSIPDMRLYGIILFLKHHFRGEWWAVENVRPFYDPLIKPITMAGRHCIWASHPIPPLKTPRKPIMYMAGKDRNEYLNILCGEYGIDRGLFSGVNDGSWGYNHDGVGQMLRNAVHPDEGKYILDHLIKPRQTNLEGFLK